MKTDPDTIELIKKDLKSLALKMTKDEVRLLVDSYYAMQENRKRGYSQVRAATEAGEPNRILTFLATQADDLEQVAHKALDYWSADHPMGIWARAVCGIGPVISACLLAHVDMDKCLTVGNLWAYCGLDPTDPWLRGEKRPWNAAMRTLCWKIGECFVKVSGNKDDIYGHYYLERKAYEQEKNERGDYAAQAAEILKQKPNHAQASIYKKGKLPDGHLHSRAKRWTVKLFLAHWWETYYKLHFKKDPPLPWPIAFGGHAKIIHAPKPGHVYKTKKNESTKGTE